MVQLQLDPGAATAAPEPSIRTELFDAEPAPAAAASEPSAPEELAPPELAPEADAMLPDLPPPELRHDEAEAGGGEQVEAPDAAPTSTGKRLSARSLLPGSGRSVLTTLYLQVSGNRRPKTSRGPRGTPVRY
jgi:hypothetical protein